MVGKVQGRRLKGHGASARYHGRHGFIVINRLDVVVKNRPATVSTNQRMST